MGRRTAALAVAANLVMGAGLVATAPPAHASSAPVLSVKPGQTVKVDYQSLVPAGAFVPYALAFAYQPADCADDGQAFAWCDTIPIRLLDNDGKPLSQKRLDAGLFALTLKLEWDTETLVIPAGGNEPLTQLSLALWDDPVVSDDDAPAECDPNDPIVNFYLCTIVGPVGGAPGGDEAYYDSGFAFADAPLSAGIIPKRSNYAATVALNSGQGVPYKLSVTLVETTLDDLVDLSADLPDLSVGAVLGAVPPTELGGSPLPDLTGGGAGFDLGPAGLGIDADLDALGAGADKLDLSPAAEAAINSRRVSELRRPGKASPVLLILWLVVLPVALLGGAAGWFLRRRAAFIDV